MPVPMLKSLAEQYGVSLETAETAWRACKKAIQPTEGGKGPGYGVVVDCVKGKLGKLAHGRAAKAVKEKMG